MVEFSDGIDLLLGVLLFEKLTGFLRKVGEGAKVELSRAAVVPSDDDDDVDELTTLPGATLRLIC